MIPALIISIFAAFGLAVAIFEKGDAPPISWCVLAGRAVLKPIRMDAVFDCPICLSMWTALATDALTRLIWDHHYWAWPLSGLIAVGLTWLVYKVLMIFEVVKPRQWTAQNNADSTFAPPP
jgi:hypothetical protein